jgi:hypothetical protein
MTAFDWITLGQFKAAGKFPDQYPENVRTFYSPGPAEFSFAWARWR